jgi:hypothetical protein
MKQHAQQALTHKKTTIQTNLEKDPTKPSKKKKKKKRGTAHPFWGCRTM